MENIILKDMGSFSFGGSVTREENRDTFHGEHGYAQYYVPAEGHNYPIIFWHGMGQNGRCWESTPDGRDGFLQIFTRKKWPVCIIDQARVGRAAKTKFIEKGDTPKPIGLTSEAACMRTFRIADWYPPKDPEYFEGLQFPTDPDSIAEFFRSADPYFNMEPSIEVLSDNMKDLIDRMGECILFTHSRAGRYGWASALKQPEKIKGIITIEPGDLIFPENSIPEQVYSPIQDVLDTFIPIMTIPEEEFKKLAKIPVRIIMGDYISSEPNEDFAIELWRINTLRGKQFADLINSYGGDAKVISLPELGIHGNTHAMPAERNNLELAELIEKELADMGLAGSDRPYAGPAK